MRALMLVLSAVIVAGCPGEHGSGDAPDAGGGGDTAPDADPSGEVCEVPASCPVVFSHPDEGVDSVELRGDFADDGWDSGIPLEWDDGEFRAEVELEHGQRVEYKFVLDGEHWVEDPDNPNTVPDGHDGVNSVVTANCDDCARGGAAEDWNDAVMYFVMVDRFADGEPSYNDPVSGVDEAANFQGGDLVGLREVIEDGYFDELGVNALWLTAPVDNARGAGAGIHDDYDYAAYHGYWPRDLDEVDPRIGTYDDLIAVIEAAHARDIRIVLDYVMNHVHEESPVYSEHPDWFVPLDDCGVCGQGCDWDAPGEREMCWFTDYLPSFDFRDPEARAFSVQNAIDWAVDLGVDGYRLDAVKHIEKAWITELRAGLDVELAGQDHFYLVGETFSGDRDLLAEYIDPQTMLDGQFDFPLRAELASAVLTRHGSMDDFAGFLDENADFYGPGALMGTFIGNHDVPRPIHLAEDEPLFAAWDDGKDRAWQNQPDIPQARAPFERLAVAYAALMTLPGVPLIYYGDEVGMPGAGDPDNRRFMQWDDYSDDQEWLKQRIAGLARARSEHRPLYAGDRNTLGVTGDVYVYERVAGGDRVYVALNRGDFGAHAEGLPAGSYEDVVTGESVSAPLELGAREARLLVEAD